MKKSFYVVAAAVIAFALGYSFNNSAISDTTPKVAVVDASELIANSSSVKALKAEQEKKVVEMQKTLEKARADIAKESDPAKIAELQEKYRKQINDQKLELDNDYNSRMTKIDTDIKGVIAEKAKSMNYDLVLPKNIVLFGGDDITGVFAEDIK